ncbi:DNA-3-methyladenine glycosylase [Streptomyces sp. MAR4 CNX-425]|uniref:DNA-3-methyladenine glycosylase n=1 Tax=Streptomyces sp. MAR4 CNX-425 TaxID=3406343 RepID=UPI003B50F4E8
MCRTPPDRSFFRRPVPEVAPDLLGRTLLRRTPAGTISPRLTGTEAYAKDRDPGPHAHRGRTDRNAPRSGPAGHIWGHFTYQVSRRSA